MTRHLLFVSAALAGSVTVLSADDPIHVERLGLSGTLMLSVSQDIEVPRAGEPVKAERHFRFDLAFSEDAGRVSVTVTKALASYTAHGQRQRLGARHLKGHAFSLAADVDRRLARVGDAPEPLLDLGPYPPTGFSVAEALEGCLPALPDAELTVGTTWTSEQPLRSLEGWGWASGRLHSRHRVTAIDTRGGHAVLHVTTTGTARLSPDVPEGPDPGELHREMRWSFDATEGRLLSLSIDQRTEGASALPQGEVRHRQHTRIELGPGV